MTNPATQVVEARGSDIQEHHLVTKQVEGHPRLHETLYQKTKQTNKKKKTQVLWHSSSCRHTHIQSVKL